MISIYRFLQFTLDIEYGYNGRAKFDTCVFQLRRFVDIDHISRYVVKEIQIQSVIE